jgi:undecaprenyl-diphosphatase
MTVIEGVILGAIQGFTEFLPVSSSGHLVLMQEILGIKNPGNEFEILLHIGTLCSILLVFFKDIKEIVLTLSSKETQNFLFYLTIGTLPAVVIGLGLKDSIEALFDNIFAVGFALIVTGITLMSSHYFKQTGREHSLITSFLIGIAQAIAIIPGISRSGMTISFALFLGLGSKQAAKFSFLLAIPVISGAGLLMALDMNDGSNIDVSTSLAGLITSFCVGFISLKWLLGWLEHGKFHYFGVYCFFIGTLTLVI